MARYISTSGTALATVRTTGTGITAAANDRIICTGGGFTITLPSSPLENDTIQVVDATGVFGSSNVTIGRNGNKIQNLNEDLILNINNTSLTLVWTGATYGWLIIR